MKMRIVAAALAVTLVAGLTPTYAAGTADKFPAANRYPGFSDIASGDWSYSAVKLCYETGLMTGKDTGFDPNGTVTVAEAATLAARMGSALTGTAIPTPEGGQWYAGPTQYIQTLATAAGYESVTQVLAHPTQAASRAVLFAFLSLAVPETALTPINNITTLPDVNDPDILRFYNAGILTGVNEYGTFAALKAVTRVEMAAMAARVARPELCQPFSPKAIAPKDATHALTGFQGGDVLFTAGGYRVTLDAYLESYRSTVQGIEAGCAAQGLAFSWGNTAGEYSFPEYAAITTDASVLLDLWRADHQNDSHDTSDALGAKHILVETKVEADALRAQLTAAGDTAALFDQLMSKHSTDPGLKSQPNGYTFGPGTMVKEFEDGTKALSVGQISQPVQSYAGYHIILRIQPDLTSYQAEKAQAAERAWLQTVTISATPGMDGTIDFATYYDNYMALSGKRSA